MNGKRHVRLDAPGRVRLADYDPAPRPAAHGVEGRLDDLLAEIGRSQDKLFACRRGKLLIVLQGVDASGKDGTLRMLGGAMHPLGLRAHAFKPPTAPEVAHDFLWRVHRVVPQAGEIAVFNRSHYEDVLVPRVDGVLDPAACLARYAQINDFERLLAETGTTILKLYLHISREEQRRRLEARLANPDKHWKFDDSDLVARAHWDRYREAYDTLLGATATAHAPWYVIPADDKAQRNHIVATLVAETLRIIAPDYPPANPKYATLKLS